MYQVTSAIYRKIADIGREASRQALRETDRAMSRPLKRDDFSSNRHPALSFCLSMIFSENRCTLFRIML
jgi:hypothetical protein